MAIFICDFGTTLPAAAVLLLEVLVLGVLLVAVLPGVLLLAVLTLDELPLLQAAAPRRAIAASGARYLKPRRLPAVLFCGRALICIPLPLAVLADSGLFSMTLRFDDMVKRPHSARRDLFVILERPTARYRTALILATPLTSVRS